MLSVAPVGMTSMPIAVAPFNLMQHHLSKIIIAAPLAIATAILLPTASAQTTTAPKVVAYPGGPATYVAPAPAPGTTYVAPTPAATAPVATTTVTVPAATYSTPVATRPAQATTTYVVPGQTYVAASTPTAPVSAAGVDYDHIRISMTPVTGYPTGTDMPSTTQQLIDDAQQIRKELIHDPELSHQDITIVPANSRITLYGTVATESLRSQIEMKARDAGKPSIVTSQIKVRP